MGTVLLGTLHAKVDELRAFLLCKLVDIIVLMSHGYMMKSQMTLLQLRGSKSIETIDLIHVVGMFVLTHLLTFLVSEGMM